MLRGTLFVMTLMESDEPKIERDILDFVGQDYVALIESGFQLHEQWFRRLAGQGLGSSDGNYQSHALQLRLRNHLRASWMLLLRGYLIDSVNALKLAFETLFLADYLRRNPKKARQWMENDLKIPPRRVREALADAEGIAQMYDEICRVAHPNGVSLRWHVDRHDGKGYRYYYGAIHDPELTMWVLERLRPLMWASLAQFRATLPPTRQPTTDEDRTLLTLVNLSENRFMLEKLNSYKARRAASKTPGTLDFLVK